MKTIVVFDDTGRKSEVISDIIGERGFADVVVKKRKLEDYYRENLEKIYVDVIWKKIHSVFEYNELVRELDGYQSEEYRIIHCFSNYIISDFNIAQYSFKKLDFIDVPYCVFESKRVVAVMFPDISKYLSFCKPILMGKKAWDVARELRDSFEIEGMIDIGIIGNFIQCIAGNFDSRYFNSLKGNEYTIVKSSSNKRKIEAEYKFYHLLPDDMKFWFVMPFDYRESKESASYTMERLYMTDLAIKWVHGSMGLEEFEKLMDKYFYFFTSRHKRVCSKEKYNITADNLYVEKLKSRINDLKQMNEYGRIKAMLEATGSSIDLIMDKYFKLKNTIESRVEYKYIEVIGHGDPCFANAMYNKSTNMLKFIDPKGAMDESELWTNPYYDLAKLSHSVCGRYDFFNNALFEIRVDTSFGYNLDIPFDNRMYMDIFKKKTEENGFNYLSVRIYEASLFISMLPLHIDNPHKVFGFILNVKNILEEIERDV